MASAYKAFQPDYSLQFNDDKKAVCPGANFADYAAPASPGRIDPAFAAHQNFTVVAECTGMPSQRCGHFLTTLGAKPRRWLTGQKLKRMSLNGLHCAGDTHRLRDAPRPSIFPLKTAILRKCRGPGHGSNEGNTGPVEPSATNPALSPIGIMVNGLHCAASHTHDLSQVSASTCQLLNHAWSCKIFDLQFV